MSDIGTRMKDNYEIRGRRYLTRRTPVIIRVDGKAFHRLCRAFDKPFDARFMKVMDTAASDTMHEIQGCKAAYVQSDEASFLLTDYDSLQTEPWLGYVQNKVESIAASTMTARFNYYSRGLNADVATFDARAFNIPREEVVNYFLWRALDWQRNSIAMYAASFFSRRDMHGKGRTVLHEMLHGIGKNWATDLGDREKNGVFITRDYQHKSDVLPIYDSIAELLDPLIHCDVSRLLDNQESAVDLVGIDARKEP